VYNYHPNLFIFKKKKKWLQFFFDFLKNKNQPLLTPQSSCKTLTLDFDPRVHLTQPPLGFAVCTRVVHLWMRGNVNSFSFNDRRMNDIIQCIPSEGVIPCNNQCWLVIEKTITPVINPGIDNLPVGYWIFKK